MKGDKIWIHKPCWDDPADCYCHRNNEKKSPCTKLDIFCDESIYGGGSQ